MFYSQFNHQYLATGYGTYFPILFEEKYPELSSFPSNMAIDTLVRWGQDADPDTPGVRYILIDNVDLDNGSNLRTQIEAQPRLNLVDIFGAINVFEIEH